MRRKFGRVAWTAVLLTIAAASAVAQRGGYGYAAQAENPKYDGRFMFARIKYTVGPGGYYYQRGMPSWAHGEPYAEENLMKIMDSISFLHPHVTEEVIVGADNPDLFKYPVAYMVEPGFWTLSDEEAAVFRAYLLKGGFIIFDDFRAPGRIPWGGGWDNIVYNMQRILPGAQFVDLDASHQIFHAFFDINSLDIVPQAYDSGSPIFRGVFEDNNPQKRLMAIINFNTDISDFWEFSGRGFYPVDSSNEAYKLGVNYIIYGLTH
jgi:hypothetical protein